MPTFFKKKLLQSPVFRLNSFYQFIYVFCDGLLCLEQLTKTMNKTKLTVMLAVIFTFSCNINAQLRDGLVAHWPLDSISGETTPDVVSGYDMELTNLDDSSVVEGKFGSAFSFSSGDQTILTRAHEEGEDLPINQHESFTISFWAKIQGNGQNDLRVFSESLLMLSFSDMCFRSLPKT